jgi:processing peptidase subunit beta
MVLVGAGAVKHEELVALAEKAFGNLPSVNNAPTSNARVQYTGSEIRVRSDDLENAHVAIGFESVGWSHPHYFTYLIIQALLGSYDHNHGAASLIGSRLAEIVNKEHLAESFQSFSTHYKNTGLFGVYGVAKPGDKFADFTYEVFQEFQKLGQYISDDSLHRAKNKVKAALLSSLDGNLAVAEDIGRQILTLQRRMSAAETFMRIDAIHVSDVKEVLNLYFNDVCPTIVGLGPIDELPDYHHLRTWTYWDRL